MQKLIEVTYDLKPKEAQKNFYDFLKSLLAWCYHREHYLDVVHWTTKTTFNGIIHWKQKLGWKKINYYIVEETSVHPWCATSMTQQALLWIASHGHSDWIPLSSRSVVIDSINLLTCCSVYLDWLLAIDSYSSCQFCTCTMSIVFNKYNLQNSNMGIPHYRNSGAEKRNWRKQLFSRRRWKKSCTRESKSWRNGRSNLWRGSST